MMGGVGRVHSAEKEFHAFAIKFDSIKFYLQRFESIAGDRSFSRTKFYKKKEYSYETLY